ncbi:putative immunoglobulin-blocking virulence protein [Mesomycoplasma ovipneumoniae]|uniref:Immunoglobulin-blocking virulence protein n=1 Tax=Mesomycoplasma ovipneumoniae TaxID=29562 RepID=A0AAJ2P7N5_9BACT|nr:putative immunoglobulin-blocking virulence protein [Mesomycoplasma ovipneumoniae]MDW2829471.1 putative immunoglobulin-blocking virulence protein [Mesomycoplasma ovipneumoniae]MDW2871082.1 putative immunoglobulin-blocking virulence protein [Mesomycoplasma ovipneumoniae]MDW2893204.1 putative immunoglobulin-blocking virulence protein [Mesomycoplasma ovipneumoniae]
MKLYFSRRRKVVIVAMATALLSLSLFSINQTLVNFDFLSNEVSYSTQAPSIISKNQPNDTAFNSPVANTVFVPPKVETPKEKIENPVKPQIVTPKIEKIDPLPEKVTPKPIKRIQTIESTIPIRTTPARQSPTRTISSRPTITTSRTVSQPQVQNRNNSRAVNFGDSAYQRALGLWRQQQDRKIAEVKRERDKYQAEVAEAERVISIIEEHWKTYAPVGEDGKPKVTLESYLEGYKYTRWVANNYLEREQNYLKVIEQRRQLDQPFTEQELQMIKDGYTPDPTTDGWEPKVNIVVNGIRADNKRRLNAVDSKWTRYDATQIGSLKYEGWNNTDVSSEISSLTNGKGFSNGSISLIKYTRAPGNTAGNLSEFKTLVLNADDDVAFKAFAEIMKNATNKDNSIKAIVLKNVGAIHKTQNIKEILELLPPQMQKVSLFLDDHQAVNGLRGLEKFTKLSELELYTNSRTNESNWAINPNALKNVDFISFDYINKGDIKLVQPGEKIPGSIIFDTLRWDEDDDTTKVNEGLEIAFSSKINQRVFQGTFGGRGGYPLHLDFSSSKKIKTLKGIDFAKTERLFNEKLQSWEVEAESQKNPGHVNLLFQYLYFGASKVSDSSSTGTNYVYKVQTSDFENSQFTSRLVNGPIQQPGIYIKDENGKTLSNIPLYITGSSFSGDALSQLSKFVDVAKKSATFNKIYVEDSSLQSQLSSLGLTVETKKIETID